MGQERTNEESILTNRIGELQARASLIRLELLEPNPSRESIRTSSEHYGEVIADLSWVTALMESGIPEDEILKIWDRKDNTSRYTKRLTDSR